ncbi:hypothetical protein [Metabacillus bambusae]|uniref:Uncharacterized protein n=1 Tax=Metabacillus bambusae TaxID=2795218 RepID=A0ABS3N4P0_9BACI|nr:hypothetical protein [Metabacillus bambusae]MBO1512843.1 hypothetical protein [Metabacillus bambusae]
MLRFFKNGSKKDANCCNVKIEEVKDSNTSTSTSTSEESLNEDEKKVCCSTDDAK